MNLRVAEHFLGRGSTVEVSLLLTLSPAPLHLSLLKENVRAMLTMI